MSIVVDKEFESLIPPLSSEEFTRLEENCVKEGIRDALIVWAQDDGNEILIDGHNRWKIATEHAIDVHFINRAFKDRDEAKAWIISNQLGRRNLEKWVRFDLAKKLEAIEKEKAKQRQGTRSDLNIQEKFPESTQTRDKMGEMVGVSGKTYDKMKTIDNSENEELKAAVRAKEISINKAYEQIKALERKVKELKDREPEKVVEVQTVEVIPDDYKSVKAKAKAYDADMREANKKAQTAIRDKITAEKKVEELRKKVAELRENSNENEYMGNISNATFALDSYCRSFIRSVGGFVWLSTRVNDMSEDDQNRYKSAVNMVFEWAGTVLTNMEGEK